MWEEIGKLFTQMSWIVIVLLVVGIVFCIIEGIIPGFGFFGIFGIICEVAGVIVHAIFSASVIQVLFLVLIMAVATTLLFLIFVFSAKHGILGSTPLIENKPSVPYNYGVDKNLIKLIGKRGVVIEECHPVGKIKIEGRLMEALSAKGVIEPSSTVRVIKIKDNNLYIEKLEGDVKWIY